MRSLSLAILALAAVSSHAGAQSWIEQGDAGELPFTAQATQVGPLTTIIGSLSFGAANPDLYLIRIVTPGSFSATVTGVAGIDTQLFLFTMSGMGIAANDNSVGTFSLLPAGHPLYGALASGPYILAVSGFNNEPMSAGGAIFPDLQTGVLGPTGLGGSSPLIGWSGGGASGSYSITLTSAAGFPAPPSMGLLILAALCGRRRRRRGAPGSRTSARCSPIARSARD